MLYLLAHPRLSQKRFPQNDFRLLGLFILALFFAATLPSLSSANLQSNLGASSTEKARKPDAVPGEILVRFRAGTTAKAELMQNLVAAAGRKIPFRVERLGDREIVQGLRIAHVTPDDTADAIQALNARPDVLYAEPNYILRSDALPNDPRFPEMANLRNTGQSGFPGNDIGAEQAWNTSTGTDTVVIGVVDTGIDIEHPDLKDNIWRNTAEVPDNGIDEDGDGYVDDVNGWDFYNNDKTVFDSSTIDAHGTHIAGTIGAVGNNGVGVVGVSWHVKLMPLKFLGSPAGTGSTSQAIAALAYAKAMHDRGVNIRAINNSWGGRAFSQALLDVIGELNSVGILFVAAAGNDGMDNDSFPVYPANYEVPNVISVGADDSAFTRASFSNFGTDTVDIYAPGINILSTAPGANYTSRDGTSMAAPHVTGTAALVCAARPGINLPQLRNSILFGSYIVSQRTTKLVTITHLKADGALQSAVENDSVLPGPVSDFHVVLRSGRQVNLGWTASGDDGSAGRAALYKISFVDNNSLEEIPLLRLQPASSGSSQQESVNLPYQHGAGKIRIVPFDNAGNTGVATSIDVSVNSIVTTPYIQTTSAPGSLSTGGTMLSGLKGDDLIFGNLGLPFNFRFFSQPVPAVSVSTNGVLYFTTPPSGTDALSSVAGLKNYAMIAGLWDDLRTDRRPEDGVYVVTPDPDRVIFRWQAVTFDSPLPGGGSRGEHPVSFEIELQRSGNIVIRYGEATNVQPIVGISGGEREPYFVGSHSSENGLIDLTNAASVSFGQPQCAWFISPASQTVPPGGYSGIVNVDTGGNCAWTATSNANWISISFTNSVASGIVSYQVSANQSAGSRSGTLTIAGQTFTVNQSGLPCSYQVGTMVQGFGPSGGASGTSVITQSGCLWSATSNASWITITSSASGVGNGAINFSVAANPGASPRTGTISVADQTVTINQAGDNPIDDAGSFVRQHYSDFLNRQPDAAGLSFWTNQITSCGTDQTCTDTKHINVSAAFFLSIEFQETGYLVYRTYKAAYGNLTNPPNAPVPSRFEEFLPDEQQISQNVVVNAPGWEQQLENNKVAFFPDFVSRLRFRSDYPTTMGAAQFVDMLFMRAAVTPSTTERAAAINEFGSATDTADTAARARSLRRVAENATLGTQEKNRAFVLMQYFGYLRRNPYDPPESTRDFQGYNFWLNKLNQFNGNFVNAEMVKAFIISAEYRQRFGPP
ncbi:MAG: S8 family serine peptidase [Acidobacteriota bacterium]